MRKMSPEHDVLVLARVHAAAQRVGHLPEFGLVAGGDAVVGVSLCVHLGPHGAVRAVAWRPTDIASIRWTDSLSVRARTSVPLPEFLGQDRQERVGLHPVHVVGALELVEHPEQVPQAARVMDEATLLVRAMRVQAQDQRHDPD